MFVSNASQDDEAAARVVVLLERAGLATWTATRDVPAGRDHADAVPDAISGSQAMVVLLSADALASPWVLREVEAAITRRMELLPLALPSFPGIEAMPQHWRFRLTSIQVRTDSDLEAAVSDLRSQLHAAPTGVSAPAPAFAPHHPVGSPRPTPRAKRPHAATSSPHSFVGAEHRDVLDWLSNLWRTVRETRTPHLAVLLGETGFGKTRIVQEFYRTIAADQPEPPFWPLDLVRSTQSGQRALRESRKRVSPTDLSPAPGAEATFLWLGHVVDEGHGGRVDTGLQHIAAGLGRALSLSGDAAGSMVEQALHPRPEPGTDVETGVVELLHTGTRGALGSVTPGSVEAFWQGVNALWSGSPTGLPAVLVVEDGHFAGQGTMDALELIATSGQLPFLIVVCAQESQLGGSVSDNAAPPDPRRPLGRVIDEDLPGVSVRRLGRLPGTAVEALIREVLPDVDEDACREAVVKADGNPYHAHTLLVEMVRAADRGRLDAAWVRGRPGTFEEELRLQWRLLPDDVRRVLSGIAVLGTQVPERIGLHALRTAADLPTTDALDASLRTGWLRRLQEDEVLRFLERPRWVIAHAEADEEWAPEERHRIIEEALGTIERLAADTPLQDPLLQELHLALAQAADAEDVPFDRAAAVRSGLAGALRLRLASDDDGMVDVARDTERLVEGHAAESGLAALAVESALNLRIGLANTIPQGTTDARTIGVATLAVTRAQRVAHRRPDLAARAYAALSRSHRARFDEEQLALCRDALREAESWLGRTPAPDALTSAEVIHAQAMYVKALGDNQQAAELADRRLALLERTLGLLDRRVLAALLNDGFYWTRVDIHKAIDIKRELLDRRRRVWGDRRTPPVAVAEKELAFSLVHEPSQTSLADAHRLASEALDGLVALRGAHHKSTSLARSVFVVTGCRLSDEREAQGDRDGARRLREEALANAGSLLERVKPDTRRATVLIRRQRVAECQARLGDPAAVDTLREILATRAAATSGAYPLDIEVLWTAAELAAALWRQGARPEARKTAERFLLTREERWPASQPRGWKSTRPQDARAGVM